MPLDELIPILQVAIGPVILISGVGLLLLSMTNRFGRVTDRSRTLLEHLPQADNETRERILAQLQIFAERGKLIRISISLAVLSILLASILVIVIFLAALLRLHAAVVVTALFVTCMASLIASLILFLRDINLSLSALQLEMRSSNAHHLAP
jgi:hypothetical protein